MFKLYIYAIYVFNTRSCLIKNNLYQNTAKLSEKTSFENSTNCLIG